jgi:hypothetical protein
LLLLHGYTLLAVTSILQTVTKAPFKAANDDVAVKPASAPLTADAFPGIFDAVDAIVVWTKSAEECAQMVRPRP